MLRDDPEDPKITSKRNQHHLNLRQPATTKQLNKVRISSSTLDEKTLSVIIPNVCRSVDNWLFLRQRYFRYNTTLLDHPLERVDHSHLHIAGFLGSQTQAVRPLLTYIDKGSWKNEPISYCVRSGVLFLYEFGPGSNHRP